MKHNTRVSFYILQRGFLYFLDTKMYRYGGQFVLNIVRMYQMGHSYHQFDGSTVCYPTLFCGSCQSTIWLITNLALERFKSSQPYIVHQKGNTLLWKKRPEVVIVSPDANLAGVFLLFVRGLISVFMFGLGLWNLLSCETEQSDTFQ